MLLNNFLVVVICLYHMLAHVNSSGKILSRQRRFLAFPQGSSFSAALCTTIGQIGNPNVNFLSYALNWGISYNLPNDTWVLQSSHGFKNPIIQSRSFVQRSFRRSLYRNIEVAIDSMGYNGNECILRALCETSQYLFGRTGNMIEEMLKALFNFSDKKLMPDEYSDSKNDDRYWTAFKIGFRNRISRSDANTITECVQHYPRCQFSLLELALGKYSVHHSKIPD